MKKKLFGTKKTRAEEPEAPIQRTDKRLNIPEQKVFSPSTSEEEPKLPDENANWDLALPILDRFRAIAPVIPLRIGNLDVRDLGLGKASFDRVVKSTETIGNAISPVVAFIKVGIQKWVVKVRTRNVFDHVVNSKLLNALSIPGVHAPLTEILLPEGVDLLHEALANTPGAADLSRALSDKSGIYGNQISEQAPDTARNLSELLISRTGKASNRLKALNNLMNTKSGLGDDPIKSFVGRMKSLGRPGRYTDQEWTKILTDLAGGPNTRRQAVALMRQAPVGDRGTMRERISETMSGFLDLIDSFDNQTFDAAVGEWKQAVSTKSQIVAYLTSPEGAGKLAAIATVDFLVGMNDRIISKSTPIICN